jgi:hypothetical protein
MARVGKTDAVNTSIIDDEMVFLGLSVSEE